MQNYGTDQDVLQTAHEWLRHGHDVILVTVLKTWGSSPRPPGSLMIMRRDGVLRGSVSGGCVEEDLVQRYRDQQLSDSYPSRVDYGVKLSPNVARPKSRGSLLLNSSDPLDKPQIDLNYFSDEEDYDRRVLLGGLRHARRLTMTGALSPYLKREITPGCDIESDDEFFAYMTQSCETVYHPCGTCAMGNENDPAAVVSSALKVRGVQGLRIADASVFPDMITVNICNTVMMVAERAVDLICEEKQQHLV